MKKVSILFAFAAIAVFVIGQQPVKSVVSDETAVITFKELTHDFGKINETDGKATYSFEFTNTGNSPLVISRAQASCGCTVPEWTKTPVEAGKKGVITATYNTVGRPGPFTKTITVYSNAETPEVRLIIKGDVLPQPTAPENAKSTVSR
jgi:hypothetical protein